MNEQQHGPPSLRAEAEKYQQAINDVQRFFRANTFFLCDHPQFSTVVALAQERVSELSRRAEAAEQDEIAWRGGP